MWEAPGVVGGRAQDVPSGLFRVFGQGSRAPSRPRATDGPRMAAAPSPAPAPDLFQVHELAVVAAGDEERFDRRRGGDPGLPGLEDRVQASEGERAAGLLQGLHPPLLEGRHPPVRPVAVAQLREQFGRSSRSGYVRKGGGVVGPSAHLALPAGALRHGTRVPGCCGISETAEKRNPVQRSADSGKAVGALTGVQVARLQPTLVDTS